jgi:hypothetical protein
MYVGEVINKHRTVEQEYDIWSKRRDGKLKSKQSNCKRQKTTAAAAAGPAAQDQEAAAATSSTASGGRKRRLAVKSYAGADEEHEGDDEEYDCTSHEVQPVAAAADAVGAAAAAVSDSECDRLFDSDANSKVNRRLAAASAAAPEENPLDRKERKVKRCMQKQERMLCVRWYTYTGSDLTMDNEEIVEQEIANEGDPAQIALWHEAIKANKNSEWARLPQLAVNRWKTISWMKTVGWRMGSDIGFLDPDAIIWYGSKSDLFGRKKICKFLEKTWKDLYADLCEIGEQGADCDVAAQMEIDSIPAAAAAAE